MAAQMPLVLIATGGTGGHVYPALAVAVELLGRGYRVEWIGTRRGLEHRVVPAAGLRLHYLRVRGIRGKTVLHKLFGAFVAGFAVLHAAWLVLRRSPDCVVGLGGYVAGPVGVATWLARKPLLVHEQNAVAGTTNRMLVRFASRVMAGFPGAFGSAVACTVVGNPLRRELVDAAASASADYDGTRPLRLLVLGGSLGAQPVNEVVPGMVRRLEWDGQYHIEVWHQAGDAHAEGVRRRYGNLLGESVWVDPFIEDMAGAYSWADLVLCRAGALTVSELALMGLPSILVPLPHAVDNHQMANARVLSGRGAAFVLHQGELDAYKLCDLLQDYMTHPQRLADMARAAKAAAAPNAAERVSDCCEELIDAR